MKFTCSLDEIRKAVNHVSMFSSTKSTIPALEGILIECQGNRLNLKAYDLEIGIDSEMMVSSEEDGRIVLPAHIFSEILKKMEDDSIKISSDERNRVQIKGTNTEFTMLGLEADEFPDLPIMEENHSVSLKDSHLKKLIDKTLFSASTSSQTPILNGAIFEQKKNILTVAAVDGYRVAIMDEELEEEGQDFKFIVPSKALYEISKIIDEESDEISKIYFGEKHASFKMGNYQVITRLLEGEFIDYRSAVPDEINTEFTVKTQTFLQSIERVSIMIDIKNKIPVKMTLTDGKISLNCESGIGKVQDAFMVDSKGENISIAYNNRYMLEALRHANCETIRVKFKGPLSPIVITPEDGKEKFIFLVLPVRLSANE